MAYTPTNLTSTQMEAIVLRYLQEDQSDSDMTTLARDALNSGIHLVNVEKWKKVYSSEDVTLVAGTDTYNLGATVKEPWFCHQLNSSSERVGRFQYKEPQVLLYEHRIADTNGTPRYYTLLQGTTRQIMFDVPPSAAFVATVPTARVRFYQRAQILSAGGDDSGISPDFDCFFIWNARKELAAGRDPAKFAMASREADMRWRMLKRNDHDTMTDYTDE